MDNHKKRVVKKGYTISVVSWENDRNHYKTKSLYFDSKNYNKVEFYYELLKFYKENLNEQESFYTTEEEDLIIDFLYKHIDLYDNKRIFEEREDYIDFFNDLIYDLIGISKIKYRRILESFVITYSCEDIFTDVVFTS